MKLKHLFASAIIVSCALAGAAEQKKSATTKKAPSAAASKKASTAKAPAKKTPAKSTAKATGKTTSKTTARRRKTAAPPRPRGQQAPTAERYKEIQQSLIDRGFLADPPTGAWGPESMDALKRFQQQQKIPSTGKLDSLTLIALGLGPQRNATAQVRPTNENRSTEGNQRP